MSPPPASEGRPEAQPDPTRLILRCVSQLPWPVGKSKLVQILNGSRAAWIKKARLDRLQTYGAARLGQGLLSEKIDEVIEMGYLAQSTGRRPTLSLTETGLVKLATDEADEEPDADAPLLDGLHGAESVDTEAEEAQVPYVKGVLEANVRRVCKADPQGVEEAIENLRYFRPDYVSAELKRQFKSTNDVRERQQIAWTMSEIPGTADERFLRNCLKDFDPDLRRLAELALKKSGKKG